MRSGLVAINQAATLEYQPLGVVGVIGPWNYPVFTPMGSIAYALAAGNAVVFKPSELTPAVGGWLVSSFAEVVPEQPVLQLVTGAGATGEHLARSAVDKIAFTGSAATAKKVMAACAENLTPMVAECGGKDALLVAADADLDAAADAAAWGAAVQRRPDLCRHRAGLRGGGRLPLVRGEADRAGPRSAPGEDREADYGPMTLPGQIEVVERHVADALARGGRPLLGGLESIRKPYVGPVILTDVPEESRAMTEETFGPDADGGPGGQPARGRPAGQRRPLRTGRVGVRREQEGGHGRGPVAAQRHDGRELGDSVRGACPSLPFGGSGTPGSAGFTAPTGCASSPGRSRSPASG